MEVLVDSITLSLITGVLTGIISNCICSSAEYGANKALSLVFDQKDIEELIRNKIDFKTVLEKQSAFEDFPDIVKSEGFCKFLRTKEVNCIVQRIYQFDISNSNTEVLSDLRNEFIHLFTDFLQLDTDAFYTLGSQLFDVLIEACNEAFYQTIRKDEKLLALELKSSYRARILQETIREESASIKNEVRQVKETIEPINTVLRSELLNDEYKNELEYIREQIKDKKPTDALKLIQKLKQRIWDCSSANVKYSILRLEASANLLLNNFTGAGRNLIAAKQYSFQDEKAIVNEAFGYLLCGDKEKSRFLALEVLAKNFTNPQAHSILIQIGFEEDIRQVPSYLKEDQNIAYALGNHYYKQGNLNEAEKWLELSIENEIENILEVRPFLALILLENVLSDPQIIPGLQLNQVTTKKIKTIIDLLTFAWKSIKDDYVKALHIDWIINRSIAKRLLGFSKEAEEDVNLAFELNPCNPKCVYFKAVIEFEHNEFEKVVSLSENYKENDFLRYEALRKLGRTTEVVTEINSLIGQISSNEEIDNLQRFLISIHLELGQYIQAQTLANLRYQEEPANVGRIIDLARVMNKSGDRNKSISLLEQAKSIISISSKFTDLMQLADAFFRIELFEDACEIYKTFVDTTQINDLTHKMVDAYYLSGDIGKSLEICKSLRNKFGIDSHITRIEIAIYNEINDLKTGKEVLIEYIKCFPNDIEMKLNLAIINQRLGEYQEVDYFLKEHFDFKGLSVDNIINLAILFDQRAFFPKAIDILYNLRRNHFENKRVHLVYINLILFKEDEKYENLLNPKEVCANSYIVIEDSMGHTERYIIETLKDVDMQKGELSIDADFSKMVLGKREGDEFLLENPVSKESLKIKEIKSKYIYALQESLNKYNYLFPESSGLYRISLSNDRNNLIHIITDIARLNSEGYQKAVKFYLEKKLTILNVATLCGRTIIEVWSDFTQSAKLGLYCCIGSPNERSNALSYIENDSKLIIDPISILTLFSLGIGEILTRNFGKFGVTQSTIDLFRQMISNQKKQSHGHHMLYDGKRVSLQEISEKEIIKKDETINHVLDWISKNCIVMPCNGALSIRRSKKEQFDKLFDKAFVDTMIIASDEGNILYAEENLIRLIGKQEFNVKGIWTQVLLMHCLANDIITKDHYLKLTIKLANLHYYHTSIDAEVLIDAARQANWKLEDPFISVLTILGGKYCDAESALNVSITFLSLILNEKIPLDDFSILFLNLMNSIVMDRYSIDTITKIESKINESIHLFSLGEREFLFELIRAWEMVYSKSPF